MTQICAAPRCHQPVGDAWVCSDCAEDVSQALGDIPAWHEQLRITATRQDEVEVETVRRRGGQSPLPVHWNASLDTGSLRHTLVSWSMLVVEERGVDPPSDAIPGMARWLLRHVEWFRHHRAGGEFVDEICAIRAELERAADLPQVSLYIGSCPDAECDGKVYLRPGERVARCRFCREVHRPADVPELVEAAREQLASATDAARVLDILGYRITGAAIRGYAYRRGLLPRSVDLHGSPLYRIGDILARLELDSPTSVAS